MEARKKFFQNQCETPWDFKAHNQTAYIHCSSHKAIIGSLIAQTREETEGEPTDGNWRYAKLAINNYPLAICVIQEAWGAVSASLASLGEDGIASTIDHDDARKSLMDLRAKLLAVLQTHAKETRET